jgi:hypothetical protein
MKKITLLSAAILLANVVNAGVFYVVPGGAGNRTGADWDNAADLSTTTLSSGAANDEFWVKKGAYQVSIEYADRALYGGFDGTETSLAQRDWVKNQTIIQGIAAATKSLVLMKGSTVPVVLDGFIIQDNHIETSGQNGGGVNMNNYSVLRNCIIRNNSSINSANVGGGVFVGTSTVTPVIENCLVINNAAANNGGGIQVVNGGALNLRNSTIANNKITKETGTQGSGFGCGVGLPPTAQLTAENCIVYNNQKPDGSGTLTFSFGANHNMNSNVASIVKNCAYDAISATSGTQNAVIFATKTACIDDLSDTKTPDFTLSTTFAGNSSTDPEQAEFNMADYRLKATSICVDAGDNQYVSATKDLANTSRINNSTVDMGAYEYDTPSAINKQIVSATWNCYAENGNLIISGVNKGDIIAVYDLSGRKISVAKANAGLFQLQGISKGIYLVKLNSKTQKVSSR